MWKKISLKYQGIKIDQGGGLFLMKLRMVKGLIVSWMVIIVMAVIISAGGLFAQDIEENENSSRSDLPVIIDGKARFDEFTNTVVTSGWMQFDYKRQVATFVTNVVVTDPRLVIKSDKMMVLFSGTNSVESVTAVGNVRFWQDDKRGSAEKAIYLVETGEIQMLGEATLIRGRESITGKRKIIFWIDEQKVICEPAELILEPGGEMRSGNLFDL